jgi:hypothetical protein
MHCFLPGFFFRLQCRFLALFIVCLFLIVIGQQSSWAATGNHDQSDQITVTIKAVLTAKGHFSEGGATADDDIAITYTETSTFRVRYEWYEQKIDTVDINELLSSHHEITVMGKGKLILGGGLPSPTWTYVSDDKHSGNYCSVGLNKDSIHGGITLLRFTDAVGMNSQLPNDGITASYPMAGSVAGETFRDCADKHPIDEMNRNDVFLRFAFPVKSGSRKISGSLSHEYTDHYGPGKLTIDYSVAMGPPEDPKDPEVELQEIDRKWLPEENNSWTAHMNVKGGKTADAFRFTLYDLSKEPGTSCNSRDDGTDPDLNFAESRNWSIKKEGETWIATMTQGGKQADITIDCHDWGAWGKLKAEAQIDGKWQPAKVTGANLNHVRIPFDDDNDHIADSWQGEYAAGKSAKDDNGKEPTGQASDGDSISVYEAYRGFSVQDAAGGRSHQRLDPRRKVLFYIDQGNILAPDIWEKASGIKGYRLSPDMIKGGGGDARRIVNFRKGYAHAGDKYCVDLETVPGLVEKIQYKNKPIGDIHLYGYVDQLGDSPKGAVVCRVFPDRLVAFIDRLPGILSESLNDPASEKGVALQNAGVTPEMAQAALQALQDQATRSQLARQTINITALHEMGHACGITGHRDSIGKEWADGDPECPMKYMDYVDNRYLAVYQVLFGLKAALPLQFKKFCRTEPYNCWSQLKVKDE